ncbi:5' nucleotidase, NT5C type [Bacterioplanoides pacificum]|uniref:Uncharacterized protein n=1 Tax=Bacterioplanoides pacificum TaxID=1171596 RepID=A0ABV7VNS1_9GAMM
MAKYIVYVDMDHTLCDYDEGFGRHQLKHPELKYPQSEPGLYISLKPLPNAIESFEWLMKHPALDVYILTAPSIQNPHCYSEKRIWVEEHLGMEAVRRLIISPNKGLNKGHYLIDDCAIGKGQENFEGELIQYGFGRFKDWKSVISFFKEKLAGE